MPSSMNSTSEDLCGNAQLLYNIFFFFFLQMLHLWLYIYANCMPKIEVIENVCNEDHGK